MYDSWKVPLAPAMDFTNQLKKTNTWEEKPALYNKEIHAKANHKITFLIV